MPSGFDPNKPATGSFLDSAEMRGQLRALLSFEGDWDSGTTYRRHAIVKHNGTTYVSLQNDNSGNEPPASGWWELLGGGAGGMFAEHDNGHSGSAMDIDWSISPFQLVTLTANCVFTFLPPSTAGKLLLRVIQGDAYQPTFPSLLPAGVAPPATGSNGAVDIFEFYYNGTDYYLINAVFDLQ